MKKTLLALLLSSGFAYAQNVDLDPNFGDEGIVVVPNTSEIMCIAQTSEGAIISAGYTIIPGTGGYHLTLAKHFSNGFEDAAFGNNGLIEHELEYSEQPFAIQLQNDGKIVVAGFCYLGPTQSGPGDYLAFVARLLPNGDRDSTFGTDGVFKLNISDSHFNNIFLQNDGSIILTGNTMNSSVLCKLTPDGERDANYGINGIEYLNSTGFYFVQWQTILLSDGNLLHVGMEATDVSDSQLAAFKTDWEGNPITTFGDNGKFLLDTYSGTPEAYEIITDVKELSDGKLICYGGGMGKMLIKINANGTPYTDFGDNGVLLHDYPVVDVLVQDDDKVFVVGSKVITDYNYGISVTRLNEDGSPDTEFNGTGTFDLDVSDENDHVQTVQFKGEDQLLVGGSARLLDNTAYFLLASIDISETLGLHNNAFTPLNIYPNPAQDVVHIDSEAVKNVRILDPTGKTVLDISTPLTNEISVAHLASGSYVLQVELLSGEQKTQQLVKL